ncbi:MAG: alpha/beta hydrolase, partial [Gammaproteobacteria bacterium]|nr:alpha/beta hydrolase [Gammaproteobacteria bacterium]
LARSRKEVRRSRLEKSNQVLQQTPPFSKMKPKHRTRLIHRESLIVAFEPEAALETLPKLFHTEEGKLLAMEICREIAGPQEEMSRATIDMFNRFEELFGIDRAMPAKDDPSSSNGSGTGS